MTNVLCSPIRAWRKTRQPLMVLLALGALTASASAQTTVTLSTPGSHLTADMTIRGGAYARTRHSNDPTLISKRSAADYTRRILIKFDTENYIPANATITSAKLYLVLKAADAGAARPLTAYWVNKSFIEPDTDWVSYRPGQKWSTPGGDLGPKFTTTNVGTAAGSTYSFDLTALVQRAVKGEFGSRYTRVALVDTGAATSKSWREFYSSEAATASQRPRLVITYSTRSGSTASSGSGAASAPPTTSTATGTTLRVMQWNVQKTKGSDGVCNPDRIANAIVAQKADVVSLNEVNFYSGACASSFDMGEKLRSLLQAKTGRTWYKRAVNVYGGSSGYGNVLLSRYQPASTSTHLLSNDRGVAHMGIYVNGRLINVFSTHVEYYTAGWRPAQIREAVHWLSGFAEPRILMGDFNTSPNTSDYRLVVPPYQDAWAAGKSAGIASAYNGTGVTQTNVGTQRFDYVFFSRVSALSLKSVTVPNTKVGRIYPSDHDPVVAVFAVK